MYTKTSTPCIPFRSISLGNGYKWEILSDRVTCITKILKRPGKGGRLQKTVAVYVGFDSYHEAQRFASQLRKRAIIRKAKRCLDWEWEVKINADMSYEEIYLMAQSQSLEETTIQVQINDNAVATYFHTSAVMEFWQRLDKAAKRRTALFA